MSPSPVVFLNTKMKSHPIHPSSPRIEATQKYHPTRTQTCVHTHTHTHNVHTDTDTHVPQHTHIHTHTGQIQNGHRDPQNTHIHTHMSTHTHTHTLLQGMCNTLFNTEKGASCPGQPNVFESASNFGSSGRKIRTTLHDSVSKNRYTIFETKQCTKMLCNR